ncbi:hypothetical protein GGQ80_000877 [Sphingomonas jinjuensis]|uniref:Uncharacterized protein n=1 Tax=Sphingomonas jinjuensis TaxID=535907 RepID=A0A840F5C1_9SPHN|nr:hypothetical protein [Sphingomonas jinjuensis]MBB4152989.1 hypothetical protein [Sphingomonas jinjuensis]
MTIGAVGLTTNRDVTVGAVAASSANGAEFAAMMAEAQESSPASGPLDFCHISPRAMRRAATELVAAGRVHAPALAAAVELTDASGAPDTPINMIAYLRHEASRNEKAPGGMELAFRQKAALATLIHVQREEGEAVVYDRDFPTAPRDLTAEEVNAKLKAAIEAFRQEASLTPTERFARKLRAEVMKDMKVSEDELKAMPEAERALLEKRIDDELARRLTLLGFAAADGKDDKAEALQAVDGGDSATKAE